MRAIVRISLTKDKGSLLRNQLVPCLEDAGLVHTSTATWEGDVTEHALRRAMQKFWLIMATNNTPATIAHFWMYVDKPKASAKK